MFPQETRVRPRQVSSWRGCDMRAQGSGLRAGRGTSVPGPVGVLRVVPRLVQQRYGHPHLTHGKRGLGSGTAGWVTELRRGRTRSEHLLPISGGEGVCAFSDSTLGCAVSGRPSRASEPLRTPPSALRPLLPADPGAQLPPCGHRGRRPCTQRVKGGFWERLITIPNC